MRTMWARSAGPSTGRPSAKKEANSCSSLISSRSNCGGWVWCCVVVVVWWEEGEVRSRCHRAPACAECSSRSSHLHPPRTCEAPLPPHTLRTCTQAVGCLAAMSSLKEQSKNLGMSWKKGSYTIVSITSSSSTGGPSPAAAAAPRVAAVVMRQAERWQAAAIGGGGGGARGGRLVELAAAPILLRIPLVLTAAARLVAAFTVTAQKAMCAQGAQRRAVDRSWCSPNCTA